MRASRRSGANGSTLNRATVPLLPKNRLVKELQDRGLDTNGVQSVLADRLLEFLSAEDGTTQNPAVVATPPVVKKTPAAKKTPVSAKAPPKKRGGRAAKNIKEEEPGSDAEEEADEPPDEKPDISDTSGLIESPAPTPKGRKKAQTPVAKKQRSIKEEEPEEEPEVADVPVEVPKGRKKASEVNGRRSVKREQPEEVAEEPEAVVPQETPTGNRRTSRKQNKENNTPANKKEPKRKTVTIKLEEPDEEPEPLEDIPSTSDAPPVSTTPKAAQTAPETPKSEEKRARKKSARLLASEQMEQDRIESRQQQQEEEEAMEEGEPEAAPEPQEPERKKQKVMVIKEEILDEDEEQTTPPPVEEPPRKHKKVVRIKEEPVDSSDETAASDPDFQPPAESMEPTRHSKRIKEHTEQSLDVYQQMQREKAERAEKYKKQRSSSSSQPPPSPVTPVLKEPAWKADWKAHCSAIRNHAAAAATPATPTETVKRKEPTTEKPELPKKKKKEVITTSIDKIEALMSSTHKEKAEKKASMDRTERIVGGSDATTDHAQRNLHKATSQGIPLSSPKLAPPPHQYGPGLFFNQPTIPQKPGFPPHVVPMKMIPMIPVAMHGMIPPPVLPQMIPRRRPSRFDQPPPEAQHLFAKSNAPPPSLTTAPQISQRLSANGLAAIPPPPRRPILDGIIPPPPPRLKPIAPIATATSDLQRRVQELFSSEPAAPAVPIVFSPRESSAPSSKPVTPFVLPPPPPPPPPPAPKLVVEQPHIYIKPDLEEEDDDDFVIRDTVMEDPEAPVEVAAAPQPQKQVKTEPRGLSATPEPESEPVRAQAYVEEDNAPKAINKVKEQLKKEALAEERRRRAMELGDGEYDPLEDSVALDESEAVMEYQPTTRMEDEEVEEMEENEGDDDEDDEMLVDDEEEEDDEDEEEEEAEEEGDKEGDTTQKEAEDAAAPEAITTTAEEEDDLSEIPQNPLELFKRALPLLHSSTVAEQPKNDYAQLDVVPTESLLSRPQEEQPTEVYYHGDPVPEVDENELYEIAAGIKPKKKDKKPLVQIPEEERVPADVDTIELDYYNADIMVKSAEKNIWQIEPFCQDGLALMWGGIRSNFGIKLPFRQTDKDKSHRLAFQIQIDAFQSIQHLPTEFMAESADVRIGFSLASTPLVLGESSGSWCITASGKRASNNHFYDFGRSFDIGDCVTCILDLLEGSISFQINGEDVGTPFEKIPMRDGDLIFPTICTKNANVNVNLGQELSDEKWKLSEDRDWMFITEMDRAHLLRSHTAPAAKKDCTVLMTVGLPGVGKTTWVRRYLAEHPHEHWTLISADTVMDAMKVNGVPRIRLPTLKRPDFLRGIIGKSMNRLICLAPRRRKNYILDMTNSMADRRKKKLMGFEEFNRKCMIFVPDEDTHQKRLIKQEHEENEKLDTDAMMQYKASISLPIVAEGEPCEELIFIDPPAGNEHIAFDRVAKMNYECRSWLQPTGRRRGGGYNNHRGGDRHNYHHHNDNHHGGGGGYHQYNHNRPSTSGPSGNQYSSRNNTMNITHTTFQSAPSPAVREEPEILAPVIISIDSIASTSASRDSPAARSSAPSSQFSFPPPSLPQAAPSPVTPAPTTPQPIQAMQNQQKQIQQKVQQKKVEVSQPLTLNTSLPRKSLDTAGPSPALSSAGGRSSSFSQNSPRFGFPTSKETTPIRSLAPTTPTIVAAPAPIKTAPPPAQIAPLVPVMPPMNISQPPPQVIMQIPTIAQMRQPPPQMMFPIDVTVPPPNFSAPPPQMPSPVMMPPHLLMYHQQQMSAPPPTQPQQQQQHYVFPPPQFAPR